LKNFRTSLGAMACALACMMAFNAHAALFEDDEARKAILELRQRLDATSAELRRSGDENAQLRRSLLDLSSQIEQLRGELARMRGQGEQFSRDLAEIQRAQKDMSQGVNDRLSRFEPSKVTVDGREFVADPAEKQEFEAALAVMRRGEFAPAQTAFSNFLKKYPQSGYKAPALFWLGNAQYALRNYRDAMVNFRALVATDTEHVRAPEAVLAIANCQVELKDIKGARKTLEDLLKAYPQSEAASVARERLARLK